MEDVITLSHALNTRNQSSYAVMVQVFFYYTAQRGKVVIGYRKGLICITLH